MRMKGVDWRPFKAEFPILFGLGKFRSLWVGQGWFEILWSLCVAIEGIAKSRIADGFPPVRVVQVKEKYGTLRFYVEGGCQEVEDLIDAAETRSEFTCEACGRPGNLLEISGWWQTLCVSCEAMTAMLPSRAHFECSTDDADPEPPSWSIDQPSGALPPRDPKLYLMDILEAVSEITTFIDGMDRHSFEQNELVRDAVLYQIGVIGTASKQIPLEMIGVSLSPSWSMARGLRDHPSVECFGLNDDALWRAIKEGLPLLACEVGVLLKAIDP